jgi:hypothetical protein
MKKLVHRIVEALVDHPEQIAINEIQGGETAVLEVAVAKEDLGKIIGKKGRTVNAIRTIVKASAAKLKKRMVLEIVE